MPSSALDKDQRIAAKVVGWAYLLTLVIVVYVNFGIHDRLIVARNPAETAQRILAHEQLFRIGMVGDLLYCTGVIVLLTALYVVLRPVNRGVALLAAFLRLIWVLTWLGMTLHLFDALRMLSSDHLRALQPGQVQGWASLYLATRFDYYYTGLLFGSLASTLCAYLWFKSRYIPPGLAAFGIVSSAWCVACTLVFYVFPNFPDFVNLWWFDTPMALFDLATSLWLLIKGLRSSDAARRAATPNASTP